MSRGTLARLVSPVALAAAVALGFPGTAVAQDSILVRVGGDLAAPAGQYVDVPVTVDLSAAPGRTLGGYRLTLRFNPAVLNYSQILQGAGYAFPSVNQDSAYTTGRLLLAALQPSGASGNVLLFTLRFSVVTDTILSPVTVTVDELTAAAGSVTPFEDLLPLVRVVNGNFCGSIGIWGDVDGDSAANSRDALIALSAVVGLPPAVGMTPALADVDADGSVTSRDALIILSYAVGLPVPGFRVMLTAASPACATGAATRVVISTDTLDLTATQSARVSVTSLDATGRPVPPTGLRWRSLDPAVAVHDTYDDHIIAHGAGTTALIAELGPGAADTIVVNVVARRANWHVDVRKARNVITQTGSSRHPMEFITDAIVAAMDGDTIRVAGGLYEEAIEQYRAVVVLGDSLDRPVIDPRGAPYYATWIPAYILQGSSGTQVLAHFVFRYGGADIEGGNVTVHHVRFDSAGYKALRIRSMPDYTNPAPGLGKLGNVLVDSVTIGDFTEHGVLVEEADSVEVRRTRVAGQVPASPSCNAGYIDDRGGIVVSEATRGWVHDNVVDGAPCQGIAVFTSAGRAVIQRNFVRNAASGIVSRSPLVATDHNGVHTIGRGPNAYYYNTRRGFWIPQYYCYYCSNPPVVPDSVVSVADTVVDLYGSDVFGFDVDTALVAVIDQLQTDSIGVDTSYAAVAVDFTGQRLMLTNSRILRTGGIGLAATGKVDVFARGNRFAEADEAIRVTDSYSGGYPDTVSVVRDSITGMRVGGITTVYAAFARVDSVLVDSVGGEAVHVEYADRAVVARSRLLRATTGVYAYYNDTVSLVADTILNGGTAVRSVGGTDTLRIDRGVLAGNTLSGLDFESGPAKADSVVVSGNALAGIIVGPNGMLRMRRSRVDANGVGVRQLVGAGGNSVIRQSSIAGNLNQQGVRNDDYPNTSIDADSVWWGDASGPNCETAIGICPFSATADSVLTFGITFANPLGAVPPTPAPPAFRAVTATATATRPDRHAAAPLRRPAPETAPRPAAQPTVPAPRRPTPGMSWQRGREPRPAAPPHDR